MVNSFFKKDGNTHSCVAVFKTAPDLMDDNPPEGVIRFIEFNDNSLLVDGWINFL
jgi:hypothetical protein